MDRSGQHFRISMRGRMLAALGFAATLLVASVAAAPAASGGDPLYASLPGLIQIPAGSPAAIKASGAGPDALSPRLEALAGPDLRAASDRAQAEAIGLRPSGSGSIAREGDRIVASARVDSSSDDLIAGLRDAGAEILSVNPDYLTVDVAVAAGDLRDVAKVDGVESLTEAIEPMVARAGPPAVSAALSGGSETNQVGCVGSRTSEGDVQMQAATARQTFGVDGTGIKVGVISDSYDTSTSAATHAAQDVASGDLPGAGNPCGHATPVQVLSEVPNGTDEGRAMVQIVHDLAPGAALAFASRGASAEAMADAIRGLRASGSNVIVDDITFFDEPMFQDGPVSVAVNEVTAAGVPYYSSAANSNVIVAGQNVGSYEASGFRAATGTCLAAFGINGACMDFDPGSASDNSYGITVNPGNSFRMIMQWAEPRNGVSTDLDIYAVDPSLGQVVAGGVDNNITTQKPFETMSVENPTAAPKVFLIAVVRDPATPSGIPPLKFTMGRASFADVEYKTALGSDIIGPTIFGHNGAASAISVAAVPYNNSNTIETFSSRGPLANYFGPVSGTTPAAPLSPPQIIAKPDLAATDGNQTTFFAESDGSVFRFSGTSASAPHAAAVAALQLDATDGALSVADVYAAQKGTAVPVPGFGPEAAGTGLINAAAAVGAHPPAVPDTQITKKPDDKIFTKRATYAFSSNLPGATFQCSIDRANKFQACASPVRVVHLTLGRHKFYVRAVNGNSVDATPATDRFKRKPKHGRH